MNYKKLIIGLTVINIIAFAILELWIYRYSGGVAEIGAGVIVGLHILGYYVVVIASGVPEVEKEKVIDKSNCEHRWEPAVYSPNNEENCIVCDARRGK